MLDQIKTHIVSDANQFVRQPEKDFSRKSQLTMATMIKSILTMGAKGYLKNCSI